MYEDSDVERASKQEAPRTPMVAEVRIYVRGCGDVGSGWMWSSPATREGMKQVRWTANKGRYIYAYYLLLDRSNATDLTMHKRLA